MSLTYPKIPTLWKRDPETFRVIPGQFEVPEAALIRHWHVTEKIHGINVQVRLRPDGIVVYGGRAGESSQLPASLRVWLLAHLGQDRVVTAFDAGSEAYLFGEGFGPGIPKGSPHRDTVRFCLFDVVVIGDDNHAWWLRWGDIESVAAKLGIETVPVLARAVDLSTAELLVTEQASSAVARAAGRGTVVAEGIVARTEPPLFTRRGDRLMWKLKVRDYTGGKRLP